MSAVQEGYEVQAVMDASGSSYETLQEEDGASSHGERPAVVLTKTHKHMKTTTEGDKKMKAIRLHEFGGPDVLRYEDAPKPVAGPGEVIVRVHVPGRTQSASTGYFDRARA